MQFNLLGIPGISVVFPGWHWKCTQGQDTYPDRLSTHPRGWASAVSNRARQAHGCPSPRPIMEDHSNDLDDISTNAEFEESIVQLIRSAYQNNVNFEGSWEVRNGPAAPDWEVLIHKLAKQDGD